MDWGPVSLGRMQAPSSIDESGAQKTREVEQARTASRGRAGPQTARATLPAVNLKHDKAEMQKKAAAACGRRKSRVWRLAPFRDSPCLHLWTLAIRTIVLHPLQVLEYNHL